MELFGFGKKKEENGCCCGSGSKTEEAATCCGSVSEKNIKVLGSGCKNCHDLFEAAKAAVKNMELTVEVEYVTDMEKIMEYGVMSMPALVVDEKVVSMGKVLKTAVVEKLLRRVEI